MATKGTTRNSAFELFYACYELYRDLSMLATGKRKRMPDPRALPIANKTNWNSKTSPLRSKHGMSNADYYGLCLYAYLYNPNEVSYDALGSIEQVHSCFKSYKQWCDYYASDIATKGLVNLLYELAPTRTNQTTAVDTSDVMYQQMLEASRGAFA